jgi:hypothetical protein
MDNPLLDEAMFKFTQEGNCLDENGIIEELTIECKSDIGIDGCGSCFYVLKTEGWSIDGVDELQELFDRIHKSLFPTTK